MREWFANPDTATLLRRLLRLSALAKNGFTLIEVVLVLAVGGLIFLLAFLAFNQVSGNRRDAHRRNDARQILASFENYAGDASGQYTCIDATARCDSPPTVSWTNFRTNYYNPSLFRNPGGGAYTIRAYTRTTSTPHNLTAAFLASDSHPPGTINYGLRAQCEGPDLVARSTYSTSDIGVWMKLEKGGICLDNS